MNRGAVGRDAALAMILGSAFGGVRGAAPIREGEAWARLGRGRDPACWIGATYEIVSATAGAA